MMSDFRVTLLGTGTPIPVPDRFGPSTLVEAGDQKLLFDAGRGASIRLHQLGVPIGSIDALLISLLGSSRGLQHTPAGRPSGVERTNAEAPQLTRMTQSSHQYA